jgi:hypothetical protein
MSVANELASVRPGRSGRHDTVVMILVLFKDANDRGHSMLSLLTPVMLKPLTLTTYTYWTPSLTPHHNRDESTLEPNSSM